METMRILFAAAWLCLFSCTNPVREEPVPGIDLTAQDLADITLIARHFSERPVDSISADTTVYYNLHPLVIAGNDFTGNVQFDSLYTDTDTDKISYQNLRFYNKYWHKFSIDGLSDSARVFVNNWYSSSIWFTTLEKTVFTLDSLTIIASFKGVLPKSEIVGYLNKIVAIPPDVGDTIQNKILADFSMASVTSISSSTYQDTTVIPLQCGYSYTTYRFTFVGGEFNNVVVFSIVFIGTFPIVVE